MGWNEGVAESGVSLLSMNPYRGRRSDLTSFDHFDGFDAGLRRVGE